MEHDIRRIYMNIIKITTLILFTFLFLSLPLGVSASAANYI